MLWHVLSQYAEHVEMFGLLSDNDGWAADELSAIDDGEAVHPTGINQLSMYEIRGLLSLVAKMEKSPTWKKRAPESVGNPNELLVKMKVSSSILHSRLSVCLFCFCLSVCLFVCMSVCFVFLSVCLSVRLVCLAWLSCLSVFLSVFLSFCLSVCLYSVCLNTYIFHLNQMVHMSNLTLTQQNHYGPEAYKITPSTLHFDVLI